MRESARRGSSAETASSLSLDAREGDPLSSAQERVLEKGSGESAASETDNRPARESDEAFVNDGDLDASSEERDSALAEQSPRGEATSSDAKAVVAISSEGEVLQKAPLPGLTFEERFRLYGGGSAAAAAKGPTPADVNDATSSAPVVLPRLEDLQSRVVSGLHALLDKAATAAAKAAEATAAAARAAKESETQKPLDLAVAAASAAFGLQGPSPEIESEVSVEEVRLRNQPQGPLFSPPRAPPAASASSGRARPAFFRAVVCGCMHAGRAHEADQRAAVAGAGGLGKYPRHSSASKTTLRRRPLVCSRGPPSRGD